MILLLDLAQLVDHTGRRNAPQVHQARPPHVRQGRSSYL